MKFETIDESSPPVGWRMDSPEVPPGRWYYVESLDGRRQVSEQEAARMMPETCQRIREDQ